MVWAGISRTLLIVIPPLRLTAKRYINKILHPYIYPIIHIIIDQIRNRFILMHDNARSHRKHYTFHYDNF